MGAETRAPLMGPRMKTELKAECARCGVEFVRRRSDHRFCSPECRKLGEWKPGDQPPVDREVVDRLFDPLRDPNERVRSDDWFAPMDAPEGWRALFAHESVGGRRRWFANLKALGEV
jgi:endogenous inhibitor of DNA gyrase (YacG/DUF329 family)